MERTQRTINKMANILNNSHKCMEIMEKLGERAKLKGLTAKQWERFKTELLTNLYLTIAQKSEKIKADLCADLWEEIQKTK